MPDTPDTRAALRRSAATGAAMLALLALLSYLGSQRFDPDAQTRKGTAPKSEAAREPKRRGDASNKNAEDDAPPARQRGANETRRADEELARLFDRQIDEGEFARARWGVFVLSLRDGRTVYARSHDRLFTPASVFKVYTTAVALDTLGADYRWRTSVYAAREPGASGTVEGDLTLYGRGAPDLDAHNRAQSSRSLEALADELYRRGVRRVRGNVVGDESYFRGEALGSGWLWEDVQWYYGAHPSALTVGGNEFTLSVAPGAREGAPVEVKLVPPTDYVRVTNEMKTSERGARPRIGITRALSSNDVRVWGGFPAGGAAYGVRLSVNRPALWAAARFRDALRARGIE
ncbi:MAG TPA: D-alanyl-D-alanine carboxypeptidase/D-alanyl-D-alanine-endopeptidase, partial [Pyrinomonadaceae bacterium]|nr:D-alanyl-D-alanine carboxypeptidase/D-alanyl-D-alanine-endopeptidase [Pyrinomonadaceae bacterium]